MKTIAKIFILGLLFFPMSAFAQKATEQRDYEVRVEWEDMQGYAEYVSYKVPIYYDDDDNVIKHGPFKINHKSDLTTRAQGNKCVVAYIVSGNYVNGKLDGVLSLEKSATISAGVLKVKGTLNFVNGEPDGTWTFTETISGGGQTGSAKLTIIFKDKKLISFNINDGKECFTINTDNNTFSGTLDGDVYRNGVNVSKFIRKTGERTKPDETAQSLISAFVAGTVSESDLIAKGFGFERRSRILSDYNWNNLYYYISRLYVDKFVDEKDVSTSLVSLIHNAKNNTSLSPACTLKRVNVISAEELIAKANTIQTSNSISDATDHILWYEDNSKWYRYYYNTNQIYSSDDIWYFTDETKLKFEAAIKNALEQKRLEQERLAEEIRLQEIERQRKQIHSICDYLVLGKSALSICYGEQRGNYFDPTGLSSTWELDLEKAIKPFCKIVACKLVSCENQGDTNVAVFDITKFNKKGNITYRLPVTIVNGKILVTSISFSNATVVE